MNASARHFARFATRATPKHAIRAFASVGHSQARTARSIPSLASLLPPFAPKLTIAGVPIATTSDTVMLVDTFRDIQSRKASEVDDPLESIITATNGKAVVAGLQSLTGLTSRPSDFIGWYKPLNFSSVLDET